MGAFSCDMSLSDWRPMGVQSCLATKNLPGRMLRLAGLLSNQRKLFPGNLCLLQIGFGQIAGC